jgi:hypothetical protein
VFGIRGFDVKLETSESSSYADAKYRARWTVLNADLAGATAGPFVTAEAALDAAEALAMIAIAEFERKRGA